MRGLKFLTRLAFQIFLYKGSHIKDKVYEPLMKEILERCPPNTTISFQNYNPWGGNTYSKNCILIGHSFGGYFSLLDAKKNPNTVRGVILLNSHFNSRGKAWYPRIQQNSLETPVLTILGAKDERLPFSIAMDDFLEKKEEYLLDRFYHVVEEGDHFMGLSKEDEKEEEENRQKIAHVVSDFVSELERPRDGFLRTKKNCEPTHHIFSYNFYKLLESAINYKESVNLVDGLIKIFMPKYLWNYIHYWIFLYSKANRQGNGIFYDQDVLWIKTFGVGEEQMIQSYEDGFHSSKRPSLNKIYRMPTIHSAILPWLWKPLDTTPKENKYDMIVLPVNENITYYKFPNPYRILLQNTKKSKTD